VLVDLKSTACGIQDRLAQNFKIFNRHLADEIRLEVRDDGMGFDVNDSNSEFLKRNFGLLGMEEHALKASGRLEIQSKPGAGTTVKATFPMP
jgi:signal transduction histidine kinase